MTKVFVGRNQFSEILDRIARVHEMKVSEEDPPPRDILLAGVRDVEGVLSFSTTKIDAEVIHGAPKLRVISNYGVGTDNIDVAAATRRGIPVGHTPDVLTETNADLDFALILACARRIVEVDAYVRQGKWEKSGPVELLGVDVNHSTLGIVGLGRIGTQVAKRAKGFSMRVLYYDAIRRIDIESILGVEYVPDLHSLLAQSDFICLRPALNEQTRHMIGAAEFAVMKPTAVLINTSRGAVVDQKALYEALKSRRILRAAIDVMEVEPIPSDDPLLTLDNLILTPHIGSAVQATLNKMMTMAVQQLLAGLRGDRIAHCVNPSVYGSSAK